MRGEYFSSRDSSPLLSSPLLFSSRGLLTPSHLFATESPIARLTASPGPRPFLTHTRAGPTKAPLRPQRMGCTSPPWLCMRRRSSVRSALWSSDTFTACQTLDDALGDAHGDASDAPSFIKWFPIPAPVPVPVPPPALSEAGGADCHCTPRQIRESPALAATRVRLVRTATQAVHPLIDVSKRRSTPLWRFANAVLSAPSSRDMRACAAPPPPRKPLEGEEEEEEAEEEEEEAEEEDAEEESLR